MAKRLLVLFLLAYLSLGGSPIEEPEEVTLGADGPWSFLGVSGYAGLVTMNGLSGSSLFYWLFEAIDGSIATDSLPLVIWLQGGPGCSGSFGMIWENISPIGLSPTGQATRTPLDYTWGTMYHLLEIDFPYGAGYSFANKAGDNKPTTQAATLYLYNMLQKLGTKYPSWFNRQVWIFGESYGGHWVPGLAYNIIQQNALNTGFNIPLQGIGIGDPWVDPMTQSSTYASFAYATSLISADQQRVIGYYQTQVVSQLQAGEVLQAEANWENSYSSVISFADGVNEYNIRVYGEYDSTDLTNFMNLQSTKTMLNVPSYVSWVSCNDTVYDYYKPDIMNSSIVFFPTILASHMSVMIYNGQDDLIVNTAGVETMIKSMNWSGVQGYLNAEKQNWMVDGEMAGYVQSYNNFTFVVVLDSGHMVPHDQPVRAKDMVSRYINGTGWD